MITVEHKYMNMYIHIVDILRIVNILPRPLHNYSAEIYPNHKTLHNRKVTLGNSHSFQTISHSINAYNFSFSVSIISLEP